jgi:hypothetical protein
LSFPDADILNAMVSSKQFLNVKISFVGWFHKRSDEQPLSSNLPLCDQWPSSLRGRRMDYSLPQVSADLIDVEANDRLPSCMPFGLSSSDLSSWVSASFDYSSLFTNNSSGQYAE